MTTQKRLLLSAAFVLPWCAIVLSLMLRGWTATWSGLGIPSMAPAFAYMRVIQASIASLAGGFDPQVDNRGDLWHRPMNYPFVWAWIARTLHWESEVAFYLSVALVMMAFAFVCYRLTVQAGSFLPLLFLFSGATLLAVERGNNDLIIFVLLYFATTLPYLAGIWIVWAAIGLKIYPVFSALAFVRNRPALALLIVGCGGAVLLLYPQLAQIRSATPISAALSYGAPSVSAFAAQRLHSVVPAGLISLLLIGCGALMSTRLVTALPEDPAVDPRRRTLFYLGCAIFLGTFVFSSNFDYRLIFLLFCMPQWAALPNRPLQTTLMVLFVISANQLLLSAMAGRFGILLNVGAKCLLFIVLTGVLIRFLQSDPEIRGLLARVKRPDAVF